MQDKQKLLKVILKDVRDEFSDEEMMHLLLERKVSANTEMNARKKYTVGQKAADAFARFTGSWPFIFSFLLIMCVWMGVNVALLRQPFDPYPFILLNLALSCVAAVQAPLIMMSQNRQEEKDRAHAENDYKVNLKTEFIIQDLHEKMDALLKNQEKILKLLEKRG